MDGFRSRDQDAGMPLEESVNSAGGGYISHICQNRLESECPMCHCNLKTILFRWYNDKIIA